MATQASIRQEITNTIIQQLESGQLPPWRKGWKSHSVNCGLARNVVSKKAYRGVNPWLCAISSANHGFESMYFGTFNQWKKLGGSVMKRPKHVEPGKWGTKIVFWSKISKTKTDKNGHDFEDQFFVLKTFTVFCIDQVNGEHLNHLRVQDNDNSEPNTFERIEQAEQLISATNADIRFQGSKAFYNHRDDFVQLPPRDNFESQNAFYETAFHELAHWTEHESRLNWDRAKPQNEYAMGELIAEISACFLMGELGLATTDDLTNHSAYLDHWLSAMRNDIGFFFKATSLANKVADYLHSFSQEPANEVAN